MIHVDGLFQLLYWMYPGWWLHCYSVLFEFHLASACKGVGHDVISQFKANSQDPLKLYLRGLHVLLGLDGNKTTVEYDPLNIHKL